LLQQHRRAQAQQQQQQQLPAEKSIAMQPAIETTQITSGVVYVVVFVLVVAVASFSVAVVE